MHRLFCVILLASGCRITDVEDKWDLDLDGDGVIFADDCDDQDDEIFPGADERCNDLDDDCDGETDEDAVDEATWYADADGDGYGGSTDTIVACAAPGGYVDNDDDCDDTTSSRAPGLVEVADDGIDQDCSGTDTVTCFVDNDQDGQGTDLGTTTFADDGSCDTAQKESDNKLDCDDTDASIYKGADEILDDGIDQNCDGGDTPPCYLDLDADGFGDPLNPVSSLACDADDQTVDNHDCDDTDDTVKPGAAELCDGQLNDCDGQMLAAEADGDGDGFVSCTLDGTWDGPLPAKAGDDCDDLVATVHPGASEICDGEHNDCDDAGWPTLPANEVDNDNDNYVECTPINGPWDDLQGGGDCDDGDSFTHPGAAERCDGKVNGCVGSLPANETDDDGDDYVECTPVGSPWAGITGGNDCNDTNTYVHPSATELCDGLDNDCNGSTPTDPTKTLSHEAGGVWTALSVVGTSPYSATTSGTLWFCDGTWTNPWTISADVDLRSRYGGTHLTGGTSRSVVTVDNNDTDITIRDMVLEAGRGIDGGGFTVGGNLAVLSDSQVTLEGCTVQTGAAARGGAIYVLDGDLILDDTLVRNSDADTRGGAIAIVAGSLVVRNNSAITGNDAASTAAGDGGGAIWTQDANVTITDSSVTDNSSGSSGGAILVRYGNKRILTLNDVDMSGNEANGDGGAIACVSTCDLSATDTTFDLNTADDDGGALYCESTCNMTLTDSTVSANDCGNGPTAHGGGLNIANGATILIDTWVTDNSCGTGGALHQSDGTVACTATANDLGGFHGNSSSNGGADGAVELRTAVDGLTSILCSWGANGTANDNSPADIAPYNSTGSPAWTYEAGDNASFTCIQATGCTP